MKSVPKYAFRVDASSVIGTGHVMRCIALALALRERGALIIFICRKYSGNLIKYIRGYKFIVHELNNEEMVSASVNERIGKEIKFDWKVDAINTLKILNTFKVDWLIVDHYQLGFEWESLMRSHCNHLMVIDDLANRRHDCDILLDQNLRKEGMERYLPLVPECCQLLIGPKHALLRPEFDQPNLRERDGKINHLLVYFGGNDQHNQALKLIHGLKEHQNLTAKIVLGSNHPYSDEVHAENTKSIAVVKTACMIQEMILADLAIGACGIAAWERCAVGLPSLVCVTADNQLEDADSLHQLGAVENLGSSSDVSSEDWFNAIHHAILDRNKIKKMGELAYQLVTGFSQNRHNLLNMLQSRI